jgi:hypothetical protein
MKIRKLGDAANTGLKGEVVKTAKTYGRLSSQLKIGGGSDPICELFSVFLSLYLYRLRGDFKYTVKFAVRH